MSFLRLVILFVFVSLSMARAQCELFGISKNGESANTAKPAEFSSMYGEPFVLSVEPPTGDIKWRINGTPFHSEASYEPTFDNANTTLTYTVENAPGCETTIKITLTQRPSYTVNFNTNGGTPTPDAQSILKDSLATEPTETITKTGYAFDGWDFDFATPITQNTTIEAKWATNEYTITWNVEGTATTTSVPYGIVPIFNGTPTKPSDAGYSYTFSGWSPTMPVAVVGDATYTAQFAGTPITYNITYENLKGTTNEPSNPTSYTIESPNITPLIPIGLPAGYSAFAGWTPEKIEMGSTGNKTFTAKWTPIEYTINYENLNGATHSNPLKYTIEDTPLSISPPTTAPANYIFAGWTEGNSIASGSTGTKTFTANWQFIKITPKANMFVLDNTQLTYGDALNIATRVSTTETCSEAPYNPINYTVLPIPTNAGTHNVSVQVTGDNCYIGSTIVIGQITINKKPETLTISSATVANKPYDGTTKATVGNITFNKTVPESGTYDVTAIFADKNVANAISVTIKVNWNEHPNYIFTTPNFTTTANITKANSVLEISSPPNYELGTAFQNPTITAISSFINRSSIIWEYKREDAPDTEYGAATPNRVGAWIVRATIPEPANGNYFGTYETATFLVTRGNGNVLHDVIIPDFIKDTNLGENYFVTDLCKLEDAEIEITMAELDMNLNYDGNPGCIASSDCGETYDGFKYYKIPIKTKKLGGVDTLVYELASIDGLYKENDTLFIETPIPFEDIIVQKWNNTILVNNNLKNYKFTDFTWFKNDIQISEKQFYSAGPTINDTLDTNDIYKVTMHTQTGERISTCAGNPTIKTISATKSKTATKKVLGINGKTPTGKIYNMKGYLTKETPAGVYIVKD